MNKKIMVIGSSGKLGLKIIHEIISTHGVESLIISDYKMNRLEELSSYLESIYKKKPDAEVINFKSIESIEAGIRNSNLVIVAAAQEEPLIQKACINIKINCIDLSVSKAFLDKSLELNEKAIESGVALLVAAGLFPGFSGILAKDLSLTYPEEIINVSLIQSKNGIAGSSGIADMLELLNENVYLYMKASKKLKKGYSFYKIINTNFGKIKPRLANFIERDYLINCSNIVANFWTAFDSEILNFAISFLRKIRLLSLFKNPKYRLKLSGFIQKKVESNLNENIAILGGIEDKIVYNYNFESDYGGTAACAVAFGDLLFESKSQIKGVLFPFQVFNLKMIEEKIRHKII